MQTEKAQCQVVAMMSGQRGVGKTSLAALLATGLAARKFKVALLDADVSGPGVQRLFRGASGSPAPRLGIRVMTLAELLDREDVPDAWRQPLIGSAVREFWADATAGGVSYVVVNLPPGFGDVSLAVLQSLPVGGVLVVTSPLDLSKNLIQKSLKPLRVLHVPVLGLVNNMAWTVCPHCGARTDSACHGDPSKTADELGLEFLGSLPTDPSVPQIGDRGLIEDCRSDIGQSLVDLIRKAQKSF